MEIDNIYIYIIVKYNSVKYVFAKGFMIKGMEIEASDCGIKLDFHQIEIVGVF